MKPPKRSVTRLVIWTVAASNIASSCTGYIQDPIDAVRIGSPKDRGLPAIKIKLSPSMRRYYRQITSVSDKILRDRSFAKEFMASPQQYLKSPISRGDTDDVMDDALSRMVMAFADDDIAAAIKNNDIKQYLLLLYQKGYLDGLDNHQYDDFFTPEQKSAILTSLGVEKDYLLGEDGFLVPAIAVCVVIFIYVGVMTYAGVLHAVAAAAAVEVGIAVHFGAIAATEVKVSGYEVLEQVSNDFDIWLLEKEYNEMEIYDGNISKGISDIMDAYREIYSIAEKESVIDADRLEQTMILNVVNDETMTSNTTYEDNISFED